MKQVKVLNTYTFVNFQTSAPPDPTPKLAAQAKSDRIESLQSEIVPDPMNAEQTWPDEHDITEGECTLIFLL